MDFKAHIEKRLTELQNDYQAHQRLLVLIEGAILELRDFLTKANAEPQAPEEVA